MSRKRNPLIKEVRLKSWRSFANRLKEYDKSCCNVLWRGQSNANWEVIASYFRDKHGSDTHKGEYDYQYLSPAGPNGDMYLHTSFKLRQHYNCFFAHSSQINDSNDIDFKSPRAEFDGSTQKTISYGSDIIDNICKYLVDHNGNSFPTAYSPYDHSWKSPTIYDLRDWAWAQHYGVNTPLVDWTKFPFYALFFAFSGKTEIDKKAIYCLNLYALQELNGFITNIIEGNFSIDTIDRAYRFLGIDKVSDKWNYSLSEEEVEDDEMKKNNILNNKKKKLFCADKLKMKIINERIKSSKDNIRILRQGGSFSYCPLGMTLEEWSQRAFDFLSEFGHDISHPSHILLTKYIIKSDESAQHECLRFLNMMNINYTSVYPDFWGLAKHVNMADVIPGYYREGNTSLLI
jgi:FRG domain-containing protein